VVEGGAKPLRIYSDRAEEKGSSAWDRSVRSTCGWCVAVSGTVRNGRLAPR